MEVVVFEVGGLNAERAEKGEDVVASCKEEEVSEEGGSTGIA